MPQDLCPIHDTAIYDSSGDADAVAEAINGRPGQRVKVFRSERCGAWHVSVAGGGGSRERRRQRRAAERSPS